MICLLTAIYCITCCRLSLLIINTMVDVVGVWRNCSTTTIKEPTCLVEVIGYCCYIVENAKWMVSHHRWDGINSSPCGLLLCAIICDCKIFFLLTQLCHFTYNIDRGHTYQAFYIKPGLSTPIPSSQCCLKQKFMLIAELVSKQLLVRQPQHSRGV